MRLIHDAHSGKSRFPIVDFLCSIMRHAHIGPDDPLELHRFGGLGEKVWQLESKLDAGENAPVTITQLLEIASQPDGYIDELRCTNGKTVFGLSDASFLFIQHPNKDIENRIASEFEEVTIHPDRTW